MLRRPYTTRALPFRDSPDEVDLVWYPALDTAADLGRVSLMCSAEWDADNQEWEPGGEVPDAERPYNGQGTKPGTDAPHVCGDDLDFQEGCKRDPSIDPVIRGVLGLPNCCRAAVVGAGGGAGGGRALVTHDFAPGPSCVLSTFFPVDTGIVLYPLPSLTPEQWAKWPVVNGVTYRVKYRLLPDGPTVSINEGAACPGATITVFFGFNGDQDVDLTATADGFFFVQAFPGFVPFTFGLGVETLP